MNEEKIKQIQGILNVGQDGMWGRKSQEALDIVLGRAAPPMPFPVPADHALAPEPIHIGKASSFADPADIRAFKKCKERGGSDQDCFKVGDNGIGCYGDDVSEGSGPSVALPPEDSEERWGSVAAAKHKGVIVNANGKSVVAVLKDRMPHRANIKNGAILDMNPDTCRALGLEPPVMVAASWLWA